jgi:hypothetical protein
VFSHYYENKDEDAKSKLYLKSKIKETRCPRGRIKRIYTESMLV